MRCPGLVGYSRSLVATLAVSVAGGAGASSDVRGQATEFTSPNRAIERCVALDRMPGGEYSEADTAMEAALCSIDFYGNAYALCPKVFSTSPGTLIYALDTDQPGTTAQAFEQQSCAGGLHKRGALGDPISYKMSVNTRETSATFANASLIYYHFARYFDTSVHVPVAVFRSIDRQEHARRVSARGVELSAGKPSLRMNHAAWQALQAAETDPSSYHPGTELFTPEGLLYGVMLHPAGKRYSAEINGTRVSGWGDGQNRDFQETAPFRALRSALPLEEAIEEGRQAAMADPALAKATGEDATPAQMVSWMNDLIDITLLDYIFSQQDRVGNVDYVDYWYWVDGGELHRQPQNSPTLPADIASLKPQHIKHTELGDNDAGVRLTYVNYTKRTGMLEKLRHYRADTYVKLLRLDADFQVSGPLHDYVRTTFGLSEREFAQVVANTRQAASILRETCKAGRMRFDVEPAEFIVTGTVVPGTPPCDLP